ncbi:MAG: hypothetical protein K0V04_23230 [Deltaproteobacteria bacterium]|nr:hypothetical protein [Deltaproteobacteria bacterium]
MSAIVAAGDPMCGHAGGNRVTADLSGGPASVPTTIETALTTDIEIAGESFEPEG